MHFRHLRLLDILWIAVATRSSSLALDTVEKWDYYEITLSGPEMGKSIIGCGASSHSMLEDNVQTVVGFYDSEGIYRIRFMPGKSGHLGNDHNEG